MPNHQTNSPHPVNQDEAIGLRLGIVSDVVCPWCLIGFKQFEQAMGVTGVSIQIFWHPFELNPDMAEEGENLRDHIASKYGTSPEDSVKARARLTALGADLGFSFNYADDMRMYNTFRAHQILYWAGTQGRQHDLKMELFSTFFTHRRNVSDPEILADAAAEIGLDRNEALNALTEGRYAEKVRNEEVFWTSRGIQGVPAMVFNERHLVVGAQGTDNYVTILRQLTEGQAA
ncbi:DsbA family oxidoreductase [Pelagibius sp. Alg239-R121]|uniref:DsbA family oxidoreductase n=1 Tax=Pelagibius sp. Alg239-R121 TaxID=2993448 RepID=UPI0024A756EC|nr:DsbA family oxidoreductase [Pelagibius sp. Alg239-R121]